MSIDGNTLMSDELELICEQRNLWRSRQESLVFVNGCFDFLHAGHRWLFQRACMLGDHLVVAVNSDEYCRRVKGPGRPTNPLHLRRQMILSETVAAAVLDLDRDSPAHLLKLLQPDVYLLGEEYQHSVIHNADCCGRVVFLPRLPGISTTNLLLAETDKLGKL